MAANANNPTRTLALVKGDQRHVFRCAAGEESAIVAHLNETVDAAAGGDALDRFDAAMVCHQLNQRGANKLRCDLKKAS